MGVYLYPNNTETPLKDAYIWIPNPTSITLDKSSINLTTIWQTEQLTATIEPTISDHSITWSSDDTTVATVSTTGLVTCVTPWSCTITATTVNGLTASCSVEQWWQPWANTLFYYEFEQNLNDSSWNWNNATGSWLGYELLNWEYVVKNTNNYANLNCPNVWTLGTGDFTFSVRMYPPNVSSLSSSNYYTIFGYTNNTTPITWPNIWYWGAEQKIAFRIIEWDVYFWPTWSSLDGRWNHIVFTRKDGVCYGYVNNTLVAQWTAWTNLPQTATRNVWYRWDYSPRPQTTKYDKAIFENVWWTAQEISNYYNSTKTNYGL